jgi:hypothetical protein
MTAVTFCAVTPSWATLNHEGKGSGKLGGAEGTDYITEPAASDDDNKNNDDNEFGLLASRLINAAVAATAVNNNNTQVTLKTLLSTALQHYGCCSCATPGSDSLEIPLDRRDFPPTFHT